MTYEHSFADSQWRSGTQPEAIVNWPPIEEEDTMTDGPSLTTPRIIINDSPAVSIPPDVINLTTFAQWLTSQPVSTDIDLIYAIAADLVSKGWPGIGYDIRRSADDLKAMTRTP